jgi:hypothetical protein
MSDWTASISVREAQQELLGASFGRKNSNAYLREYGKPYEGEMEGECGWAELNLNN